MFATLKRALRPIETSKTLLYSFSGIGNLLKTIAAKKGRAIMKNQMSLPKELDGMVLIETLISAIQPSTGVIIVGENYEETASQPIVRVYLITMEDEGWVIETELQAFTLSDIESSTKFVSDLPNLSAIDILIRMSGYQSNSLSGSIGQ